MSKESGRLKRHQIESDGLLDTGYRTLYSGCSKSQLASGQAKETLSSSSCEQALAGRRLNRVSTATDEPQSLAHHIFFSEETFRDNRTL